MPVPYQPFNAFLSYNVYRDEGKSWTGSSSQNDTLLTINKFAHFFKIDALPQVGLLWEGLLGAGHVTYKDNNSNSGMIDPQTGVLAWIRPTPTWTTGPGKDKDTGDRTPSSDELALGVGNHFSLSDKLSADAWYLRGVDGRNTTKTNSVYLKLVYLF